MIFLFKFKMGCKAMETTHNINNAFGPGTAKKCTLQWWFKKFCRRGKGLEDEECSGWQVEVDKDQLRAIIEADLTTTGEVAKELSANHSMIIWHLKQIGKVKKLSKWVPHELTTSQKNHHFEVWFSLILCNNSKPFLNWIVTCNKKWTLYYNQWWPAQWLNRERSYKALSKVKLAPKKGSWSLFGDLLLVWSTTAFWILAKPLHLRSMLSKSMRYTEKSATSAASIGQQKGPNSSPWQSPTTHHATNASKVEWTGLRICFIHHIHLSSHQLSLLQASQQLFAGKTFPQPAGGRICFPRVCWILKHGFLGYRNKLISHWQKCVDC